MNTKFFSRSTRAIVAAIIACGYFFTGCAPQLPPTKEAVAAATMSVKDPYTGVSSIDGPTVEWSFMSKHFTTDDNTISTLRWGLSDSNSERVHLTVSARALSWMFLNEAYVLNEGRISSSTANPLRDVDSGAVIEVIGFLIPKSMLKSHKETGLSIRLSGSKGSVDFTIPAYYIQGYLEAAKN